MHSTGYGCDFHRFAEGRELVLGGVRIGHPLGLEGHSDADVLVHAVCDALLGAACLGDIGDHFPDSDPALKDVSSIILLEKVSALLKEKGWEPGNIDATLILEEPRLSEVAALYRELGFEVRLEPVDPGPQIDCRRCLKKIQS